MADVPEHIQQIANLLVEGGRQRAGGIVKRGERMISFGEYLNRCVEAIKRDATAELAASLKEMVATYWNDEGDAWGTEEPLCIQRARKAIADAERAPEPALAKAIP